MPNIRYKDIKERNFLKKQHWSEVRWNTWHKRQKKSFEVQYHNEIHILEN